MNTATNNHKDYKDDKNPDKMEHSASVLRDMLASSLKQLDERWHDVVRPIKAAKDNPLPYILTGSGVLLAIAGSITLGVLENRRRSTFSYKFKKGFEEGYEKGLKTVQRAISDLC